MGVSHGFVNNNATIYKGLTARLCVYIHHTETKAQGGREKHPKPHEYKQRSQDLSPDRRPPKSINLLPFRMRGAQCCSHFLPLSQPHPQTALPRPSAPRPASLAQDPGRFEEPPRKLNRPLCCLYVNTPRPPRRWSGSRQEGGRCPGGLLRTSGRGVLAAFSSPQ